MRGNLLLLFVIFVSLEFALPVLAGVIALPNPLCPGGGGAGCISSFPDLISAITTYISAVIGSLAVVMFIWAGILFLTSAGNEGRLGSARKALWWAVIGTAIALAGAGLVAVIRYIIGG